ncbi:MAG: TIGR02186 family protein [Sphingomonadaceae bacterium]
MTFRHVLLAVLTPLLLAAASPKLVPDVSQRRIDIIYSFTGAELLLFGAILYPGGRVPDREADIAVVLRGPAEPILVREKSRIAGIWMNTDSARFRTMPSFYAVASSRPLSEIVDERTAAIYELGIDNLQLSPSSLAAAEEQKRFETGLVDLKRRGGFYVESAKGVEITDDVLYRARIDVPARVPVGKYTAETYLIQDGRVLAVAVRKIEIDKSGFERFVAMAAQEHGFIYGLCAVAISLLFGWAASAIFRRR